MNQSEEPKKSQFQKPRFHEKLKKEIPTWIQKGWIQKDQAEMLLTHYAPSKKPTQRLTMIFGTLGALLIGLGAISFFAANWSEMSKLSKLFVLFTSLGLSYAITYFFRKKSPVLSKSFLFLSTILFGANIFLIAQMYNIQAQYPDGILVWTLSTLLVAYWMNFHPAFILAIVLSSIWTESTRQVDGMIHWSYLLLLLAFLPWIYTRTNPNAKQDSRRYPVYLLFLAFFFWNIQTFSVLFEDSFFTKSALASLFEMLLSYSLILLLFPGIILETKYFRTRFQSFTQGIQNFTSSVFLLILFIFTFQEFVEDLLSTGISSRTFPSSPYGYWTLAFLSLSLLGLVFLRVQKVQSRNFILSIQEIFFLLVLIFIALPYIVIDPLPVTILNNALFLMLSLSLIYISFKERKKVMLSLGYISFGLFVFVRYFETIQDLIHQGLFFILGGILVLGLGFLLEKSRRKLLKDMDRHAS